MGNIQPIFSNNQELKEWLLNVHEKYCIELKKAQELSNKTKVSYKNITNQDVTEHKVDENTTII